MSNTSLETAERILRTCKRREPRFCHEQAEYVLTETEWKAICRAMRDANTIIEHIPVTVVTEMPVREAR